MSKAKFEAAKELIAERRYDEARVLLRTIGHPTAEHWLRKLDELDPPGAKPAPPIMPPPADYEPILRRWVEVEKTMHVLGALFLVLIAGYLFIADPLRPIATTLIFDQPQIRDAVLLAIPLSMLGLAGYAVWRSTQDGLMRRFVLREKPSQFYFIACIALGLLVFLSPIIVSSNMISEDRWMGIALVASSLLLAAMSFWRGRQASSIRQAGYVDPRSTKRSITINF
jgi:hypothetical protein